MAAGFQCWGSHGLAQIDGNYLNTSCIVHTFIAATSTDTPDVVNNTQFKAGAFTFYASNPFVAWRCPVPCAMLRLTNNGDGTYTAFFIVLGGGANIEIFVFDQTPTVGSNNGLQVFNAAGVLVFDSNFAYTKIIDFWNGNPYPLNSGVGRQYSVKCAVMQAGPLVTSKTNTVFDEEDGSEIITTTWVSMFAWNPNDAAIAVGSQATASTSGPEGEGAEWYGGQYLYLVMDVSHIP